MFLRKIFHKCSTTCSLLLLLSLLMPLSGCSKNKTESKDARNENELSICATFYPLYIMLLNITDGVADVKVSMLAPANTGCLHDYQLTTRDMTTIENCDILVANGAGMEDFLDKALELKNDRMIVASRGYSLVDDNAHIWVSPAGAIYEVQKIANGLEMLDSAHADLYAKNTDAYVEKLAALSDDMHARLNQFAGTKVITFHEAFTYFTDEFHLKPIAVIERDAGTEPSAKELSDLVKIIKDAQAAGEKIALFAEPQYPAGAAEVIANETGLTVGELDPAVTGEPDKDSYLSAMKKNTDVLEKMLSTTTAKSSGGGQ
jgi:zinc transport system substrate-binding protein